jgi:glucan phosphoethanolaminetransferase (alkaline phosphatase superfamily)
MNTGPSLGRKFWSYKTIWVSFGFALALMIFEDYLFIVDYFSYLIFYVFAETENVNQTFIRVGLQAFSVFVVTAWYVWAALVSRLWVKWLYLLIFTLIVFIEYGYQNAADNYLAIQDVYTALASPQHWDTAIINYINWLAIVPVISFAAILWRFRAEGRYGLKLMLAIFAITIGLNLGTVYYANLDSTEQQLKVFSTGPSISIPSFFRTISHLGLEQLALTQFSRQTISFRAKNLPDKNVVFIIDESVRFDHLSVNGYERSTTPFLEQLEN